MKKLRHILNNLPNILNGWWNYFFQSEDIEKLASRRAIICKDCVYNVKAQFPKIADDTFPWLAGKKCGRCDCPLPAKVRSKEEKCDAKKW